MGGAQRRPGPVTNLTATRTTSALTITWAAPTGATVSDGYEVRVSMDAGTSFDAWADASGATYTISNPPAATNYAVEVRVKTEAAHDRDGVIAHRPAGRADGPER